MGNIACYDYTAQSDGYLRAGLVNANDVQAVTSGTYTKGGITYTLTKTTGTLVSIVITAQSNSFQYNAETFNKALDACGIRAQDLYTGLISHFLDPGDNNRYGFNPDYISAPYINISQAAYTNYEQSKIDINFDGNYSFSGEQYTPDPTGYTTSDVGIIFLPLRPDNSLGAIGVVRTYINRRPDSPTGIELGIFYFPSFTTDTYDPEAGETGFKPTGAYTTNNFPGQGGRPSTNRQKKSPDYASDTVTQPGAPNETDASAIGTGFITAYNITKASLAAVKSCLWGTTLEGFISGLFVNPLDYIVSLCVFPYKPTTGASTPIKLGRFKCSSDITQTDNLGFDASGLPLVNQFKVVSMGTVQIPENWGNFLDYSQTTIELYLPFIGTVNIDASECMGGSINVEYTIDFFTGMCVANVLCERSFNLPSGKLIPNRAQHSFQGNCAIQIPLSRTDYGSMVGSLINACTQAITNPVAGFVGLASDAVGGGFRPNVSSKGNIVANSGFCSVLYPYVRLTRPITAEPDSYQEVMGYPSYIDTSLGYCSGLCICDEIDLKGVTGATESELNKIRQYCKDGVYV